MAKQDLLYVLNFDPDNVGALINLGFLYGETNNLDSAIYYLELCVNLNEPNAKLGAFMSLGFYLNQVGKFKTSLSKSDSALKYTDNNRIKGSIYNNKGFSFFSLDELDSANFNYQLSLKDYPNNPYLMKNLGLLKIRLSDQASACKYFNLALEYDRSNLISEEVNNLKKKNCK